MIDKYYKAVNTLLEMASDRGYITNHFNLSYRTFKVRYDIFMSGIQNTGALDMNFRKDNKMIYFITASN